MQCGAKENEAGIWDFKQKEDNSKKDGKSKHLVIM